MSILRRIKRLENRLKGDNTQTPKSLITDEDRGLSLMALYELFYDEIYGNSDDQPGFEVWIEFIRTVDDPEFQDFARPAKKFCTPTVIKKYMEYYDSRMEYEETRKRIFQNKDI
jgi:hypothetical protein